MTVPVICIDGPGGAGKGTIAKAVANALGYHILDSGAIYRLMALATDKHQINSDDISSLKILAENLDVVFDFPQDKAARILLEGENVTDELRLETTANRASELAPIAEVRAALLQRQRDFAQPPGLVADGRDMGTVVFPESMAKFFLTASAEERATRRHKQLQEQGKDVSIASLLEAIEERDMRDRNRSVAPLRPAEDAIEIDTTEMSIEEVVNQVLERINQI